MSPCPTARGPSPRAPQARPDLPSGRAYRRSNGPGPSVCRHGAVPYAVSNWDARGRSGCHRSVRQPDVSISCPRRPPVGHPVWPPMSPAPTACWPRAGCPLSATNAPRTSLTAARAIRGRTTSAPGRGTAAAPARRHGAPRPVESAPTCSARFPADSTSPGSALLSLPSSVSKFPYHFSFLIRSLSV